MSLWWKLFCVDDETRHSSPEGLYFKFLCVKFPQLLIQASLKNNLRSFCFTVSWFQFCTAKQNNNNKSLLFIWSCEQQTHARHQRMIYCQRAPSTGQLSGVLLWPKAPNLTGRWNSSDESTPFSFLLNGAAAALKRDGLCSVNAATAAIKHIESAFPWWMTSAVCLQALLSSDWLAGFRLLIRVLHIQIK